MQRQTENLHAMKSEVLVGLNLGDNTCKGLFRSVSKEERPSKLNRATKRTIQQRTENQSQNSANGLQRGKKIIKSYKNICGDKEQLILRKQGICFSKTKYVLKASLSIPEKGNLI